MIQLQQENKLVTKAWVIMYLARSTPPPRPNSPSHVLRGKQGAKALCRGGTAKPRDFQVISRAINKSIGSADSGQLPARNRNTRTVSSSVSRKWKLPLGSRLEGSKSSFFLSVEFAVSDAWSLRDRLLGPPEKQLHCNRKNYFCSHTLHLSSVSLSKCCTNIN